MTTTMMTVPLFHQITPTQQKNRVLFLTTVFLTLCISTSLISATTNEETSIPSPPIEFKEPAYLPKTSSSIKYLYNEMMVLDI